MLDNPSVDTAAVRIDSLSFEDLLSLDSLCWLHRARADVSECLRFMLEMAVQATSSRCGVVFIRNRNNGALTAPASLKISRSNLKTPLINDAALELENLDGAPWRILNPSGNSPLVDSLTKAGARSVISVPMKADGTARGFMLLGTASGEYSRKQAEAAATIARYSALAIERAEACEKAQETFLEMDAERSRLESILTHLADGVVVCDADSRIVLVNRAAEEIMEVHAQDILGKSVATLRPTELRKALLNIVRQQTEPTGVELQLREVKIEVGQKIVRVSASPITTAGQYQGLAMALQDITAEEELGRAKAEFVSTVGHELKTPLTSLKGSIGLALGQAAGAVEPKVRELLGIAENNLNRLIRLVDDMMDIANIENGRMGLRLEPVSLYECAVEAVKEMQNVAAEKPVSLAVRLVGAPQAVVADPDRMEQVITNLLSNAIRFSPVNSEVIVTIRRLHGHVRVSVQDFGTGIPGKDLKRIFDKFYQVGGPAHRKDGGSGLGLAISKAIVEQHGGRIYARSIVGQGSSFIFAIPVINEADKVGK
ncbi:MAG: ATP-binding protein [Armatimonadota bacterium]|nr:ATP-binding protein [Armatimonadota bacterium]